MNENIEAAEMQAQLDECQRIISAQAGTIAVAHKDIAILKSHSEVMSLRTKKAEEGLIQFKADVMKREARALMAQKPFTYEKQPGNVDAWRIGEACSVAANGSAGDYIDRGLGLLKELQAKGYGVVALNPNEKEAARTVAEAPNDVARIRNGAKIMERALETAAARIKELEDALRPLARNVDMLSYLSDNALTLDNLRIGDLRRAAALLEKS